MTHESSTPEMQGGSLSNCKVLVEVEHARHIFKKVQVTPKLITQEKGTFTDLVFSALL